MTIIITKNKKTLQYILGLPKTIYFNFKLLKFKEAIKLPIFLSNSVLIKKSKGNISINGKLKTGMIKIGFGDNGLFDKKKSRTIIQVNGEVIFNGIANIGHGSKISVYENGILVFGDKFKISAESSIMCSSRISFGNDCLLSWDILLMDTDHHKIIDNIDNKVVNFDKEIIIGSHVWIGCRCTILKGVQILDNTVIAANSCVCNIFCKKNIIVAGNPAKIIKENINWQI